MEVSFRSPSVSEEDVQEIFDSHNIPNLIGDSPLAAAECVVEATTFDDTKFQKEPGWINGMESMEVELGSKGLVNILAQDGKLTLDLSHLTPGAVVAIEVVFFF